MKRPRRKFLHLAAIGRPFPRRVPFRRAQTQRAAGKPPEGSAMCCPSEAARPGCPMCRYPARGGTPSSVHRRTVPAGRYLLLSPPDGAIVQEHTLYGLDGLALKGTESAAARPEPGCSRASARRAHEPVYTATPGAAWQLFISEPFNNTIARRQSGFGQKGPRHDSSQPHPLPAR